MASQQPIYVNDDLFLGRVEEQKEFRRILPGVMTPPPGEELPYVVLLYGGGGMGKTTLAHRFQTIATTEPPCESFCQTLWIDWEDERDKHAALQVGREHIRADVLFERIHAAAIREEWGKHFKKYQKMCQEQGKAEQEAAKALAGGGEQNELGRKLAGVTTAGLAKVIRLAVPIGDTGEAIAQGFMEAGVHVLAAESFHLLAAVSFSLWQHKYFDWNEANGFCQIGTQQIYRNDFAGIAHIIIDNSDVSIAAAGTVQFSKNKGEFGEVLLNHVQDAESFLL